MYKNYGFEKAAEAVYSDEIKKQKTIVKKNEIKNLARAYINKLLRRQGMNIGIMSMQRIINYGSFLQAYGLKKTIQNMGHTVTFVDYRVGKPLVSEI